MSQPPDTAEEKEEKSEEEKERTLEVHACKRSVHKPWVSLGSEKEVEEESVKGYATKVRNNKCNNQISQKQIYKFLKKKKSEIEACYPSFCLESFKNKKHKTHKKENHQLSPKTKCRRNYFL